jgi:hypothetical protein
MKDIAEAAAPCGIPGVVVDGQDVMQVYNAANTAVDRARAGEGPTLIEAKTYRYYNHWGAPGAKPGELGAFGYDPLAISSFRFPAGARAARLDEPRSRRHLPQHLDRLEGDRPASPARRAAAGKSASCQARCRPAAGAASW